MKDMTDVTARHQTARKFGKQVFRDDDGGLWVVDRAVPDDPLNDKPFTTTLEVSRFVTTYQPVSTLAVSEDKPFRQRVKFDN